MDDWELLQDYVRNGSDEAFARLVERHTDMVYAFCFRQMRNRELAEEAAQTVFIVLARKAATLKHDTVLSGWLFKTARFAIANALKIEARKRRIRMRAQAMANVMQSREQTRTNDDAFALLDDAMAQLPEFERHAILLKYFEQRTLAEVGTALNVSTDAAEKRITRAIDKLHGYFAQRGIVLSLAGMGSLLAAAASQMAPSGFAASIAKNLAVKALLKGNVPAANALADSTLRAMAWARWKPAFATTAVLVLAFAAIFVSRAGANSDLTARAARTNATRSPVTSPDAEPAAADKKEAELQRLFAALLGDAAGRDEAGRRLEAVVHGAGQSAFTRNSVAQIRASPAFDARTKRIYLSAGADENESVNAFTTAGVPLWSAHCGTLAGCPVLAEDTDAVLIACENANGADAGIYAVHLADGKPFWTTLFSGLHRNCLVEANGRVYVAVSADAQDAAFAQATHIASRDAANGAAVWNCDVNAALPAAKTRETLEYLAQNQFGEHSWHEPGGSDRDIVGVPLVTAGNRRVVSQTKRFLFGIDTATGKLLWSTPCLRIEETHFAARNGFVFAGTDDGLLLAVRALDGKVAWTLDFNNNPAAEKAPHVFEIRDNDFLHGSNRIGAAGEPTVDGNVLFTTTTGGWTSAWQLPDFELPEDEK